MHERSARLLDLFGADHDYAEDVRRIEWLAEAATPLAIETVLDVGCGTGNHLAALRPTYEVQGLDLDPAMLAVAGGRNPGVSLHLGDMTRFDLGERFHLVLCLGSAIGYATTVGDLAATVANLARHANPDGVVVVVPWVFFADWQTGHLDAEFVDRPDLKAARFTISGLTDGISTLDMHYLVASPDGVESFAEHHRLGLFSPDVYLMAFAAAGLDPVYLPDGLPDTGVYVGVKRAPVARAGVSEAEGPR